MDKFEKADSVTFMSSLEHILVVDDDPDVRHLVRHFLEKNGFRVSAVGDGQGLRSILEGGEPIDLIVLDLVLPDDDGLVLCRNLRASSNIPVIIVSARGEEVDRIVGLEMGADDYLPKPFHPRELLARVRSVLRRINTPTAYNDVTDGTTAGVSYRFAGWVLDIMARQLYTPEGEKVTLSGSEFALLRVFLNHPNHVLSRDQLLEYSYGRESDPYDRTIDMQVSRLRRRLREDPKNPELIKTIRGMGYLFAAQVQKMGATL